MPQKVKKKFLLVAIVGFFICVSVFLIELDYIVLSAFSDVFNIFGGEMLLLGLILLALSGGFMVMLLIDRYYTNTFIRFLYLLTSIWMGIFVYLFLASLIYVLVNYFIKVPSIVGILLFSVAIIVSLSGIIHGRKITVKRIRLSLSNLPMEWRGKKLVWMSDLHLGPIKGVRFAEKITEVSNSLSPDIVFIGGDLYDGSKKPDPLIIAGPLRNLSARQGVFFITGNHEEFGDPTIFLESVQKLGMKILYNRMVLISGLQIIGVDYLSASHKKQFQKILENMKIDRTNPSILLKHEPKDLDVALRAGISFQISGHTHKGQQWPFNYLTSIMYKGFSYGLKYYRSMPVYVSSGAGGWGPPLRVGSNYEIVEITLV